MITLVQLYVHVGLTSLFLCLRIEVSREDFFIDPFYYERGVPFCSEKSGKVSPMDNQGKHIPGRGNSICVSSEVGMCLLEAQGGGHVG